MDQINIPQRNQQKDCTSFIELINNKATNEFTPKITNENNKENSQNLSSIQNNKSSTNKNSKEKKKSNRYYQVRNLLFKIYNI